MSALIFKINNNLFLLHSLQKKTETNQVERKKRKKKSQKSYASKSFDRLHSKVHAI